MHNQGGVRSNPPGDALKVNISVSGASGPSVETRATAGGRVPL